MILKFEILQELPKCDTESHLAQKVRKCFWEKKMVPKDFLDSGLPQTFNFLKYATSVKCNKVK